MTVKELSGQILQIQAQAPLSTYAEQLANAVAASYVTYTTQLETNSAGPAVTALQQEAAVLIGQVKNLQAQIDTVSARIASEGAGSSAGQQDANLLASLRNEQGLDSIQLNSVTDQISSCPDLVSGTEDNTTRILQSAAVQPVSEYRLPVTAGIVGFAIGLLGSAAFVLIRLQRSRRLRFRDEIARAAGAPVIASLEGCSSCTTASAWRELLESRPRATAEWALRHVLHTLLNGEGQRRAVRVISFAGDSPALTAGPRLALHAARSGIPTALLVEDPQVPGDDSLMPLRAAFTGAEPVSRELPLAIGLNHVDPDPPQLLVSIALFDGKSAIPAPPDTINLLSISPGFVTADEIAQLALEMADANLALDGIVVANPDPTDSTSGLIADDTLHLLPAGAGTDGGDNGLVRMGQRTGGANGSAERLSSREH